MDSLKTDDGDYLIGELNCIDQFDLFVALGPVFSSILRLRLAAAASANKSPEEKAAEVGENIDRFALSLSKIPRAELHFVLETCLKVCQVRVGAGLAKVWVDGAGLSNQRMPLLSMLRITYAVIDKNLTSFFDSAALILASLAAKETA